MLMSGNNGFCSLALGSPYVVICEVRRLTKQDPGITREKLKKKKKKKKGEEGAIAWFSITDLTIRRRRHP